MKNGYDKALLLFLAAGLLLCTMLAFLFPAPVFSERENRRLANPPFFSFRTLADGSFSHDTDAYFTERFPLRNGFREIRAAFELALGKMEVNGVILGHDGHLIKRIEGEERVLQANLKGITKLEERLNSRSAALCVAVAPRKMDLSGDVLPRAFHAETNSYALLEDRLPGYIDLRQNLTSHDWYRTDHHWTTAGAYAAYAALCPALGITPYPPDDFTQVVVTNTFFGTTDAAAGIPHVPPDEITLYRFAGDEEIRVLQEEKEAPFQGFYDMEKLQTRDGYGVFLGGNFATLRITSDPALPQLVLIKDSFANSLLPFLARHYNILAVDPRYTNAPLTAYTGEADQVLILVGMQSLGETALFSKL